MEEVMRKMSQITTAPLKISILALLFIVTAAPHIRDYGGTKLHQENASKGGIVANETLIDAVAPINGFNPHKNNDQPFGDGDGKHELSSNKLGFSHHANVDKVAPKTNELGQASRNSSDALTTAAGKSIIKPEIEQVSESDPFAITGTVGEHGSADHAYDHHDQGLVSPADGHDPSTKTPTFQSK
jgi:hypothetical protein